jgi:hypothetical protein
MGRYRAASPRALRLLLAGGVIAAIGAGLVVRSVFDATLEEPSVSADARTADPQPAPVAPPLPPPIVSGWVPGGSAPAASDAQAASGWSSESFAVARPNPYDIPGDPSQSMVGIAPKPARARAALAGKRTFTNDDLLGTRGPDTPPPPTEPPPVPVQ